MATAIEWGLITALVALGISGAISLAVPDRPKEEPVAVEHTESILKSTDSNFERVSSTILTDKQTGCEYIFISGSSVFLRYKEDGTPSCPKASVSTSPKSP